MSEQARMEQIRAWCEAKGIVPAQVCDMDYQRITLTDTEGRVFHEVATNLWASDDPRICSAVFLGTGKHQGGIVLRPLYVNYGEGWYNISTGRPAPAGMLDV